MQPHARAERREFTAKTVRAFITAALDASMPSVEGRRLYVSIESMFSTRNERPPARWPRTHWETRFPVDQLTERVVAALSSTKPSSA